MSDYKVEMINDGMQEFYVDFHGPSDGKSSIPIFCASFHFWCFCLISELYKIVAIMGLCYFCFIFLILVFSTICGTQDSNLGDDGTVANYHLFTTVNFGIAL